MSKKRKQMHTAPPQQQTPQPDPVQSGINRKKTIIAMSLLIVLLVAGGTWAAFKWSRGSVVSAAQTVAPQATAAPASEPPRTKVVVYYFHGTYRCQSCTTIEMYTEEAVKEAFAAELKSGALEWKAVNVETPETQHFIQDYKLYTKSVIVSEVADDKEQRWKNLAKVWELLHNEKTFKDYVKQEIAAYLKEQAS